MSRRGEEMACEALFNNRCILFLFLPRFLAAYWLVPRRRWKRLAIVVGGWGSTASGTTDWEEVEHLGPTKARAMLTSLYDGTGLDVCARSGPGSAAGGPAPPGGAPT